jgi:DNA-binding Lrp family transcriptional regulator
MNIERPSGGVQRKAVPAPELDNLDRAILAHLNQSARRSFRDIAKALKISISTVSSRVKRMEAEGIIQGYIPLVDRGKLGFDLPVIIGIRISHGKILEVQRIIAKDARATQVYDVTGEWDSMVMASFHTTRELNDFVKKLAAMENVERTYTSVVLNIVKDEKRVEL